MGSPAGFLSFQGKNAINNAHQNINVDFTFDPKKGLYFNNDTGASKTGEATACNYVGPSAHDFIITEPCTCNTCE